MSTPTMVNSSLEFLLRFAASGYMPARWFYPAPKHQTLKNKPGPLKSFEVVSHCWQYSHLLAFQLQSLVDYPPTDFELIYTGFYNTSDDKTVELIAHFEQQEIKNVRWNFQPLPKNKLLRRAIGRNKAAKTTKADWIWFTDCDVIFGKNTCSSLQKQLSKERSILVFPEQVLRTALLCKDHSLLNSDNKSGVDLSVLVPWKLNKHRYEKATGAVQIVHGDIARKYGYCEHISCYQTPQQRWVKTYEDRAFRWVLGTHGTPRPIENVSVIRHEEKGRYKQNTMSAKLRKANRRLKDKLFAR
ncbi:glycosyltransferase family 2 protein [Pseudidiomarina sp. E22-M8]|uniref:glycosyltransferase family 2 protein n=1 Tax=Pseudidiomarina sp. E22-M8 TaxID=3424768 RepID=UPI00403CA43B